MKNKNFIFILFVLTVYLIINQTSVYARVCSDVSIRNSLHQFSKLENCTVIEGSLIIALLYNAKKENFTKLSFPDLVEVTDYIIIYQVEGLQSLGKLFPSLTIIRGQHLFFDQYSFYVSDVLDLQDIGLTNLSLIQKGLVAFENNPNLCYTTTVNWHQITGQTDNEFKNNQKECNVCSNEKCPLIYSSGSTKNSTAVTNNYLCWSEKDCQKACSSECNRTCFRNRNECCPNVCFGSCYEQDLTPEQINETQPKPDKVYRYINNNKTAIVCTACRKFELNGVCHNKCPPGYYEFKERRCISKEECIAKSKIYVNNVDPTEQISKKPILFKAVDRDNDTAICSENCPTGYMLNPENDHSCVKCGYKCFQQCDGGRVENLKTSEKFKQCTNLNGDLIISLQESSSNLEENLAQNLGSIETITGYLRVSKSPYLYTLHFLKNLREIGGQTLDRQNYSLIVMDNSNLAELFNFKSNTSLSPSSERLKITRGKIFFQLNPKLCLNEIYALQNYTNLKDIDPNDVPDYSNGDKAICNVETIYIYEKDATFNTLLIEWTPFKPNDFRTLLGYDIWYKPAPHNLTSKYENRDLCNQHDWKVIDRDVIDDRNDSKYESELISQLEPATRYAFYIKANVLVNRSREVRMDLKTGISELHYFTTKPTQPSKPAITSLHSLNEHQIQVSWKPPDRPNGKIEYYKITLIKEDNNDNETLTDCELKPARTFNPNIEEPSPSKKADELSLIDGKNCCKCDKKDDIKNESAIEKKIRLENLLHNTVYTKMNSSKVKKIDDVYLRNLTLNELLINVDLQKFKKQIDYEKLNEIQKKIYDRIMQQSMNNTKSYRLKKTEFRAFNFNREQMKAISLNPPNLAKVGLNDEQIKLFGLTDSEFNLYKSYQTHHNNLTIDDRKTLDTYYNINKSLRKRSISNKDESVNKGIEHIVYNQTSITLYNLTHFTHYKIKVEACLNISDKVVEKSKQCSQANIQTTLTNKKEGADDIDESSITVIHGFNTTSANKRPFIHIKWNQPNNTNGPIKFYKVELKNDRAVSSYNTPHCIIMSEYKLFNGFKFFDLQPGNYSFRIRAVSQGGKGNWTKEKYFFVPEQGTTTLVIIIIISSFLMFIVVASVSYVYYYKQKENLFISVNPDYITYEPDEWEVRKEDVEILLDEKLGKGNWGIVYKGIFKKSPTELIPVAVKTSNSKKMEDRALFLREASAMKNIDCHHIVRLIGVVSKSVPVLVLMEMMDMGDLNKFLRKNRPKENDEMIYKEFDYDDSKDCPSDENNRKSFKKQKIKKEKVTTDDEKGITLQQIYLWAIQIADGLAYLEDHKFVHRDIAARNCLLSKDLVAKVGDFGMARDIYNEEYYQKVTKGQLAIRWAAPECLRDGVFSNQSDVWSYGVLLYEMVSMGSQPYQGLSAHQVHSFLTRENGKMQPPDECPDVLAEIMKICWNRDAKLRPSFMDIIKMLIPHVDSEEFREKSFYYANLNKPAKLSDESNSSSSKKGTKKDKYLKEKQIKQEDGSDEGLLNRLVDNTKEPNDEYSKESLQFQTLNAPLNILSNSLSNNLSNSQCFSDLTSKKSESCSENDSLNNSSSSKTNSTEKFEYKYMTKDNCIVEIGDRDTKKETELKNRKNIQSTNQFKKNSCQSSDSSCASNDDIDLIQTNSKTQLPNINGNILLNS